MGIDTAELIITFGADFDRDLDVDGADLLAIQREDPSLVSLWHTQYGSNANELPAGQTVPGPSSVLLLITPLAVVLISQRKKL